MKEATCRDFDTAMHGIIHQFSSVKEAQVNTIPFEGSWTAGQLAQHVILSASGFNEMLHGPVKPTNRPPDELVAQIKKDFSDFTTKMKSPDFIVPEKKEYDQAALIHKLENIRKSTMNSIGNLDLTQTCTGFELPGYGFLTRLEAVYFVVYHVQRHIHQLRNIEAALP